jgi:hypothetical protein
MLVATLLDCGSVVVKAHWSKPDEVIDVSIYLILPAERGPGVYLGSNINEYQKKKNNVCAE